MNNKLLLSNYIIDYIKHISCDLCDTQYLNWDLLNFQQQRGNML